MPRPDSANPALPADTVDGAGGERSILPVRAHALTFAVGRVRIIDAVDLTLRAGGCTVIMGYNGAGKSVLLRLLHGLLKPSAGRIEWSLGLPPKELARRQAMVFQHPVVLRRSVADNIRYAMRVHRVAPPEISRRLDHLLDASDLAHLADRPATVLSGGERQRLALVRAMSTRPEVMFLDEPTASLDPASARAIEKLVTEARNNGVKIVLVTQSVSQGQRMADDVVFLHNGRVAEHSSAARFFADPESHPAQAFIAGSLDP